MLKVKMRYYLIFFLAAGSRLEEIIELKDGSTIGDLLANLIESMERSFARRQKNPFWTWELKGRETLS